MWFLKGKPTEINIQSVVVSLDKGYQQNSITFTFQASDNLIVALPYPWTPNKPNGSFQLLEGLPKGPVTENAENITKENITIYEKLRDLRKIEGIDLMNVHEIMNWHVEDVGVAVFNVAPNTTYQINYTHKIAIDSCLFIPTRIPSSVMNYNPKVSVKLWLKGAILSDIHKKVEIISSRHDEYVQATFKEWDWGEDVRFHTFNWESSDDGESSGEE